MKKQSGFTLIELMVVMAIIAILATAGLSAYTGYIKKARDTTRIADVSAINTIVLSQIASDGKVPATIALLKTAIQNANNNQNITDPLTTKSTCLTAAGAASDALCDYYYKVCDSGTGYGIATRLESTSNVGLYTSDNIGVVDADFYEMGSCTTACTAASTPAGCPAAYLGDDYTATIL